jgi:hypothetical protein
MCRRWRVADVRTRETRSQNDLDPPIQLCLVVGKPEEDPDTQSHLWLPFSDLCLLASRKEVIQPQVPLRLPCYDFTPVADLTVVGCPPRGLAHRLQVKPTPMV